MSVQHFEPSSLSAIFPVLKLLVFVSHFTQEQVIYITAIFYDIIW